MPTPIFVCGAECGLATRGTLGVGVEHWQAPTNTPTVVTSGPATMRSTRAFRFNTTASAAVLPHTFATAVGSPATAVGRFYIYFATLPDADTILSMFVGGGGTLSGVTFIQSNSTLRAFTNTTNNAASGIAVTTGVWYRVDVKSVFNTTFTTDIQVDGVAGAQASSAGSAQTCTQVQFGVITNTRTADIYIDDIIASGTSGDYPIAAGTVVGLYPNADGSHSYSATTDFLDGGTAGSALAASGSEVDTWQSLQNPLSTTIDNANFITNQTATGSEFLEWQFDNTPSTVASVNGLMVVACQHAATATGNLQTLQVNDNGTINAVYTDADFSEITIVVATKTYAVAPSTSGAWSKTLVDGLRVRWVGSADVAPDPILDGVCIEVDVIQSGGITPTGATVSVTAGTPAIALHFAPTGATVTATAGTPTFLHVSPISPTGATVTITPGTPALRLSVTPVGATVSVTPGIPAIAQSITPTGATVTVTPGTPTFLHVSPITPTGATVAVTPGTPAIALSIAPSATVTVAPGTPAIALAVTPTGATVSVTPGTPSLDLAIAPTGATVSVTPGTATVADASAPQDVTPTGATVSVTAGTPAIALSIAPTGATVSIVAGTPELALSITPSATVDVTPGTPSFLNPSPQAITPVGATVSVTAGTPAVALSIAPTAPTVSVTAGTVTLDLNVTPSGATVAVTPGTASVSAAAADQAISPVGPTVTVTAGTPALALSVAPSGATVSVTAGTPSLALAITPTGPVVTITTGTPGIALTLAPDGATVTITPGTPALALAVSPIAALVTVLAGTVTVERQALGGGFPPFLSTDFRVRPHDSDLASVGRSTLTVVDKHSGAFTVRPHESDLEVNQHE